METVESLFSEALRRAKRVAWKYGLSEGNATMLATDAAEAAWLELRSAGDMATLPRLAAAHAKMMARREWFSYRRFSELADHREEGGGLVVGIDGRQEDHLQIKVSLGRLQEAIKSFEEQDEAIVLCMLRGMSFTDIAKQIGRAVPLLTRDIQRIRAELTLRGISP